MTEDPLIQGMGVVARTWISRSLVGALLRVEEMKEGSFLHIYLFNWMAVRVVGSAMVPAPPAHLSFQGAAHPLAAGNRCTYRRGQHQQLLLVSQTCADAVPDLHIGVPYLDLVGNGVAPPDW